MRSNGKGGDKWTVTVFDIISNVGDAVKVAEGVTTFDKKLASILSKKHSF